MGDCHVRELCSLPLATPDPAEQLAKAGILEGMLHAASTSSQRTRASFA